MDDAVGFPSRTYRRRAWLSLLLVAGLSLGCGDDGGDAAPSTTTTAPPTTVSTVDPPAGEASPEPDGAPRSAVDLGGIAVEPLGESGGGVAQGAMEAAPPGYREIEYLLSGTAALYEGSPVGPVEINDPENPYVTRILVRRPDDPGGFSGRVVVEPFNTSSGSDLAAAWGMVGSLIPDQGDAWVGVSVRWISMTSLQDFDPVRYESVTLPTNALAWDILAQLGGLLKEGTEPSPLADLEVDRVYMAGYSQNGIDTATFASAFGQRSRMSDGSAIYDGYLPLAHSGSMAPIDSGASAVPPFEFVAFGATDVPVIDVESESDVLGFSDPLYTNPGHALVRRDDSDDPDDLYRLWEIPGAAHVKGPMGCLHDGTTFPLEFFVRAAYRRLIEWVEEGMAAPRADRIEMQVINTVSEAARDPLGNALGGVRSPFLDVPIASYQGGDTGSPICGLAGVETLLSADELATRYGGVDDHLEQFRTALGDTIDAGFLLAEDEDSIVAHATARAEEAFG